jgi:hypothetical protein
MLNELYELAVALDHHRLLKSATHPNIGTVGKATCMLIELDRNGNPRAVRILQKDETSRLWKHSKKNHKSFPAIRIQKPLLPIDESKRIDEEIWKKANLTLKSSLLNSLCFDKLNEADSGICISDWSINELTPVLSNDAYELAALRQLISCFPKSNESKQFCEKIVLFLKNYISACSDERMIDFVKELLLGTWDKKSKKYVAGCLTYYDVYETNDFHNKVIAPETAQALISLLNKTKLMEAQEANSLRGLLSGKPQDSIGKTYPNPNLPILGLTYLYAKNSDIPCLIRYGMSDAKAFQAGKDEVAMISDALAFLTDKSRENKSWKAMADSNGDKPNLLLAYLTDDPQNDALLAQILDDPTDYEESETAFDALCQQVLGSIKNISDKNPQSKINLIILGTLDPGRKQIVYGNSLSAQRFRDNMLAWAEASKNYPPIVVRVKEKTDIRQYKPICPGPNEICQLMKLYYTRSDSSRPLKQSGVSLHEIYQLYMPQSDSDFLDDDLISNIIHITISKVHYLLGSIGQKMTADYAITPANSLYKQVKNARIAISLISILLWRLGVRKENYMLDAPFNVGQFLKLADMLHKQYCVQVRNGGDEKKPLPTQLMGNEMLAIASENPIEGLNRLRERMKIYLAWADTATGEDAGLAKWILARFSEVSAKIVQNELPENFSAAEQAQVLLGYLAAIPYEKKEDENND